MRGATPSSVFVPFALALALALALPVLAGGCSVDSGGACEVNSDCDDGLVCNMYSHVCAAPEDVCETARDCADPARPFCNAAHLCDVAPFTGLDVVVPVDTAGQVDTAPPGDTGGGGDVLVPDLSPDTLTVPCPEPAGTMLRATTFEIHDTGRPGEGLDVDGDPATCAPSPGCSDGVDNALAGLAFLANAAIRTPVQRHELNLLLVSEPAAAGEGCFTLLSRFAAATQSGATWTYAVEARGATPPCAEGAAFLDACRAGAEVTGGFSVPATFPLAIPLFGAPLEVPVHDARIVATLQTGGDGAWTGLDALVAGIVYKDEFDALLDSVPTDALPPGTDIHTMVYNSVTPDIDRDGDGTADAISVGLHIVAEPVTVTGFADGSGG